MHPSIKRVEAALRDLRNGKIIILTDASNREDEADFVLPAETITIEKMNFIIRHSCGIVCVSLTTDLLKKINLSSMIPAHENTNLQGTPFTVSIDATNGITTGVSTADRTKTVQTLLAEDVQPDHFVKPGHIFPLHAKEGGVLERQGHTEGSNDLVRLAGFKPVAVICEVMNADGTMTRGAKLKKFSQQHQLTTLSIEDLITYRLQKENLISDTASTHLPIENYGSFKLTVIKEKFTDSEHLILLNDKVKARKPFLVRVHSSCTTGDLFASERCDCHKELHYSLQRISEEGGMIIYLHQEGRGIGLLNKIKAYSLQENGFDTIEANEMLGLPVDSRKYFIAANILRNYKINSIRLLTNNPDKINSLLQYGIAQVKREPIPIFHNKYNYHYLKTKKEKLNHSINLNL